MHDGMLSHSSNMGLWAELNFNSRQVSHTSHLRVQVPVTLQVPAAVHVAVRLPV